MTSYNTPPLLDLVQSSLHNYQVTFHCWVFAKHLKIYCKENINWAILCFCIFDKRYSNVLCKLMWWITFNSKCWFKDRWLLSTCWYLACMSTTTIAWQSGFEIHYSFVDVCLATWLVHTTKSCLVVVVVETLVSSSKKVYLLVISFFALYLRNDEVSIMILLLLTTI